MPYTLWSRGILIGATDFALGEHDGRHLAGVFQPAESGLMLLPALTAMAPALFDLNARIKAEHLTEEDVDEDPNRFLEVFENSPEGKRVIASCKEVERLELHAPDGELVVFESILVSDLLEMKRFGFRTTPLRRGRRKRDQPADPIRYLISTTLAPPEGVFFA
ncbi:MAG TPA: hypothetical protein VJN70_17820 [Gemmatimonadaceae bacterium]|nr:hypothetical protein [Gemmatimonadaceae bacterium]